MRAASRALGFKDEEFIAKAVKRKSKRGQERIMVAAMHYAAKHGGSVPVFGAVGGGALMVAYNFQTDFAPDILSGRKLSTIRPNGKRRHAVAGDELQLFVGMRTSSCRLLLRVPCLWSQKISIHHIAVIRESGATNSMWQLEELARIEGFASWPEMRDWFDRRYGLPVLNFTQIRWEYTGAASAVEKAAKGVTAP